MRRVPKIAEFAITPKVLGLLTTILGIEPFPVRSIFFDKTPEANWLVPWHQDLSIAVKQRVDLPGYGPWSTKDGVPHVQPPVEILESMIAVRFTWMIALNQMEPYGLFRVLIGWVDWMLRVLLKYVPREKRSLAPCMLVEHSSCVRSCFMHHRRSLFQRIVG